MKCTSQSFTTSLTDLLMLLQDFRFSNDQDQRALIHGKKFLKSSKGIIMHEEDECDHADLIWRSRCPNKLKIFAWLLFRGRLNTRDNLFDKHIAAATACPRCNATSEGTQHLFIACPKGCVHMAAPKHCAPCSVPRSLGYLDVGWPLKLAFGQRFFYRFYGRYGTLDRLQE